VISIVTGAARIVVPALALGDFDAVIDRSLGLRRVFLAGVVVAAWDFACELVFGLLRFSTGRAVRFYTQPNRT
jgi:hypothetical protein